MAAVRAQGRELSFPRPSRHGLGGDMQEDCDLGAAQVGRFWWTSHRGPLSVTSSTTEMVVVQPSGLNRLFCLDVANLIDTSISAILHTYKRSRFARIISPTSEDGIRRRWWLSSALGTIWWAIGLGAG